jgi:hypothetical protein
VEEEEASLFVHHTFHLAGASDVATSTTKKAIVRKTLSIGGAGLDGTEDKLMVVELRGRAEATED